MEPLTEYVNYHAYDPQLSEAEGSAYDEAWDSQPWDEGYYSPVGTAESVQQAEWVETDDYTPEARGVVPSVLPEANNPLQQQQHISITGFPPLSLPALPQLGSPVCFSHPEQCHQQVWQDKENQTICSGNCSARPGNGSLKWEGFKQVDFSGLGLGMLLLLLLVFGLNLGWHTESGSTLQSGRSPISSPQNTEVGTGDSHGSSGATARAMVEPVQDSSGGPGTGQQPAAPKLNVPQIPPSNQTPHIPGTQVTLQRAQDDSHRADDALRREPQMHQETFDADNGPAQPPGQLHQTNPSRRGEEGSRRNASNDVDTHAPQLPPSNGDGRPSVQSSKTANEGQHLSNAQSPTGGVSGQRGDTNTTPSDGTQAQTEHQAVHGPVLPAQPTREHLTRASEAGPKSSPGPQTAIPITSPPGQHKSGTEGLTNDNPGANAASTGPNITDPSQEPGRPIVPTEGTRNTAAPLDDKTSQTVQEAETQLQLAKKRLKEAREQAAARLKANGQPSGPAEIDKDEEVRRARNERDLAQSHLDALTQRPNPGRSNAPGNDPGQPRQQTGQEGASLSQGSKQNASSSTAPPGQNPSNTANDNVRENTGHVSADGGQIGAPRPEREGRRREQQVAPQGPQGLQASNHPESPKSSPHHRPSNTSSTEQDHGDHTLHNGADQGAVLTRSKPAPEVPRSSRALDVVDKELAEAQRQKDSARNAVLEHLPPGQSSSQINQKLAADPAYLAARRKVKDLEEEKRKLLENQSANGNTPGLGQQQNSNPPPGSSSPTADPQHQSDSQALRDASTTRTGQDNPEDHPSVSPKAEQDNDLAKTTAQSNLERAINSLAAARRDREAAQKAARVAFTKQHGRTPTSAELAATKQVREAAAKVARAKLERDAAQAALHNLETMGTAPPMDSGQGINNQTDESNPAQSRTTHQKPIDHIGAASALPTHGEGIEADQHSQPEVEQQTSGNTGAVDPGTPRPRVISAREQQENGDSLNLDPSPSSQAPPEVTKDSDRNKPTSVGKLSDNVASRLPQVVLLGLLLLPVLAMLLGGNKARKPTWRSSLHTPPMPKLPKIQATQKPRWKVEPAPQPQININNIHRHGIENMGGQSPVEPVQSAENILEMVMETTVLEPTVHIMESIPVITLPTRQTQLAMATAVAIVSAPVLIDFLRGWPKRQPYQTRHLPDFYHWVLLAAFGFLVTLKLVQISGISGFGNGSNNLSSAIQLGIRDILQASRTGGEAALWFFSELLFGQNRTLLGMILAAGGVILLARLPPPVPGPEPEYVPAVVQLLYLAGVLVLGALLWNA